jgi:hypothetical protein
MTPARIASLVAAGVASLLAIGFLAAGGVLLWGNSEKNDDGYLTTQSERFAASTHALTTDDLDVDLEGAGWFVDRGALGKVRIKATPNGDEPVFVGIARTSDVAGYLGKTARTSVTDVEYSPFEATYHDHAGGPAPAPPGDRRIWAASAEGSGAQTVTWEVEDGNWSVVVMNADGSRGVDADITAGTNAPWLAGFGWGALGGGLLLLVVAGTLTVLGVRTPRGPAAAAAAPIPA